MNSEEKQTQADGRAKHLEKIDQFGEALEDFVGFAREGNGLSNMEIARILLQKSREMGWNPVGSAQPLGESTALMEARAHERAMEAYKAIMNSTVTSTYSEHSRVSLAERAYCFAYDLAIELPS